MAGLDDLSRSNLADILRRLRALETASPLQNASIGSNGLRVYDGGVITIENGGLRVTGSAEIIGELIASGTISFTGDLTQSGESTFTGPTHLDGDTDVTGTLDVEGVTTLKNDVNVTGDGKITAGNTKITPSASNGGIEFVSGGGVGGNAGTVVMRGSSDAGVIAGTASSLFAGPSSVYVTPTDVTLSGGSGGTVAAKSTETRLAFGTRTFVLNSSGTFFAGLPTTTNPGNLYVSPTTGQVFRSTV